MTNRKITEADVYKLEAEIDLLGEILAVIYIRRKKTEQKQRDEIENKREIEEFVKRLWD
jgi:hypothetical protein